MGLSDVAGKYKGEIPIRYLRTFILPDRTVKISVSGYVGFYKKR